MAEMPETGGTRQWQELQGEAGGKSGGERSYTTFPWAGFRSCRCFHLSSKEQT